MVRACIRQAQYVGPGDGVTGESGGAMQNIQAVVYQCQEGQPEAFTDLFSHFKDKVYDVALAIMRDESAAEGVVQDTFLAVFLKIGGYRSESKFDTWLTAIAVNECRMRLRKRKIRQALSLEQLSPRRLLRLSGRDDTIPDIVQNRQRDENLWNMVDLLPERLRLPIILRYRYGLSCGEIANILKRRTSTIYQLLHEGRRDLERMAGMEQAEGRALMSETKSSAE